PPAKRRKRNVVNDDDDDQDERSTPAKKNSLNYYFSSPDAKSNALRNTTRSSRATSAQTAPAVSTRSSQFRPPPPSKSPSQSPTKARKPIDEKGKSANIRTLFSKQSQKAKTELKSHGRPGNKPEAQTLDITSDPLSEDDDEDIGVHRASGTSLVGKKAQKRSRDHPEPDQALAAANTSANQRFLRPSQNPSSADGIDQRPWSERFNPENLDELVVHKKKVADVRRWLEDVLGGRMRQRLLVLKGSAGTGKTTTMRLLSRDMGFEILEWRNPDGASGLTLGTQSSSSAQFEEFVGRGRKFGQLEFDVEDFGQLSDKTDKTSRDGPGDDRRRVILIEEFPNTFLRSGNALTSFRRTVLQFLATNTPSLAVLGQNTAAEPVIPVVMIISETLLTTTSASADSFTAHRLLGAEILRHPGTGVIEFNDIAPTLLAKALELVVKKEARVSGRRRTPGPQVLKRLGEIGDIRNAVSSLEFLCLKGDDDADWGSKVTFTKTKKASKDQALTRGEQQSLELISQRESSLGIFHAVGKVVYNKRDEQPFAPGSEEAIAEALPPHLTHMSRNKRSQVAVDALIDETGTDTSTFISALHENYVLSCDRTSAADAGSSIDYINGCIDYLSESDLLNPSWDIFFGGKGFSGSGRDQGSHILRQDEMAFEVAVRGLLFSLPCPVRRKNASTNRGGDTFKMFYPTSIKLWRMKEELEGLVDLWASTMLKRDDHASASTPQYIDQSVSNGASNFRKSKAGSVGDWVGNRGEQKYAVKIQSKAAADHSGEEAAPLLSLGTSARQEMILERLPYMAQMMRHRRTSFYSLGLRDLEKVVSFQGIGAPVDEELDEEAEEATDPTGESWATDKSTEDKTPRKRWTTAIKSRSEQSEGSMISSLQVHKLVLSDDDIED
ncbi:hypothetical protein M406DRAFT_236550, partial [Cryphonectria parasitica EP155]